MTGEGDPNSNDPAAPGDGPPAELDRLLARLCDQSLDAGEAARLNHLLASDRAARWRYLLYMELHGSLHWDHAGESQSAGAGLPPAVPAGRTPRAHGVASPLAVTAEDDDDEGIGANVLTETLVLPALADNPTPGAAEPPPPAAPLPPWRSPHPARRRWWPSPLAGIWAAAAAVVLVALGTTGSLIYLAGRTGPDALLPTEARPDPAGGAPVAAVVATVGARWETTPAPTAADRLTADTPLALAAGIAKFRFDGGAEVIIQGPARFTPLAAGRMALHDGRITASVERGGEGFAVQTPQAEVVDLGTEFGVSAAAGGGTEVHVFQGAVTVTTPVPAAPATSKPPGPAAPEVLRAGSGIRMEPGGATGSAVARLIPADPVRFVRGEEFTARAGAAAGAGGSAHDRWLAHTYDLRRDPRVISLYTFQPDPAAPGVLRDVSGARAGPGDRPRDGTIEAATWAPGRFPGKQSLRFAPPRSRVTIDLPGRRPKLTLAAWINPTAPDNAAAAAAPRSRWEALLMTRGYAARGYAHWQLGHDGRMSLSLTRTPPEPNFHSDPVLADDARRGAWHHAAVVYDQAAGTVRFFLDGRNVGTAALTGHDAPEIGRADFGNWDPAGQSPIEALGTRAFDGRMDEFVVFADALTDEQVRRLWEAGRPDPADPPR